jgi:hypothetical protein
MYWEWKKRTKAIPHVNIQERMLAKTSNTTLIDKYYLKYVTRKVCPEKADWSVKHRTGCFVLDPKVIAHEQFFQNLHTDEIIQIEPIIRKI